MAINPKYTIQGSTITHTVSPVFTLTYRIRDRGWESGIEWDRTDPPHDPGFYESEAIQVFRERLKSNCDTLGGYLTFLEFKENISGNELARRLGFTSTAYWNDLKKAKRITVWQKIALHYIEKHGTKSLPKKLFSGGRLSKDATE